MGIFVCFFDFLQIYFASRDDDANQCIVVGSQPLAMKNKVGQLICRLLLMIKKRAQINAFGFSVPALSQISVALKQYKKEKAQVVCLDISFNSH